MPYKTELFQGIVEGNVPAVVDGVNAALAAGESAQDIMGNYLIPAMADVGEKFECNEYFVPELLIAGRAMSEAMKILNPLLRNTGVEKVGRCVIGTVQGDLHDIGKNLVASMLEGGGFDVHDLGVDVAPSRFVEMAVEKPGTIICLSALLTTTMPMMRKVIEDLEAAGIRAATKVMIGGAPVTQEYADQIHADGYSENASSAVALARRLAV